MSEDDRRRWDRRHEETGVAPVGPPGPPPAFATVEELFPARGGALDLACGAGRGTVWLARRGMDALGVDVSPVAVRLARDLAAREGVADRCRFEVADLDDGLPAGPPVDLLLCHLFFDPRLHRAMADRLAPGGLLAVAVRSEVGGEPGRHRAPPGALGADFAHLDVLAGGEGDGLAWILARRPRGRPRRAGGISG